MQICSKWDPSVSPTNEKAFKVISVTYVIAIHKENAFFK